MKKYIADLLSLIEVIMGCSLLVMTILRTPCDLAIWFFVTGELCDAFDGIAARRWPYPPGEKPHWWRVPRTVQFIEHLSDILILSALAFYLLTQGPIVRQITLTCGIAIAGFCIGVEVALRIVGANAPKSNRQRLIIVRRIIYLVGIAIGVIELLACTTWPVWLKAVLYAVGILISVVLVVIKWDRLTNSHQTFREFLRQRAARNKDR